MPRHCEYMQQIEHLKIPVEEFKTAVFDKYKSIKQYAYIIHTEDRYTEAEIKAMKAKDAKKPEDQRRKEFPAVGELKKPHVHVYLNFGRGNVQFATVAKWFKEEGTQWVARIEGRKSDVLEYLTHKNAPEKFQYDDSLVVTNMDIKEEIEDDRKAAQLYEDMENMLYDFAAERITFAQAQLAMREYKKQLKTDEDVEHWNCVLSQIQKFWKQLCMVCNKDKRSLKTIFIHGKSGAGKSAYAQMIADALIKNKGFRDMCRSSSNNDVLQDYMGEDILILDDFRDEDENTGKAHSLTNVLKMIDPFFMSSSESRYHNKTFTGKLILITSAKDPLRWFEGTKEQRWQFFRRISSLIEITPENVKEYSEVNMENGIPFDCGFTHGVTSENFIGRATLKSITPNPVPLHVRELEEAEKKEKSYSVIDEVAACFSDDFAELKKVEEEDLPF